MERLICILIGYVCGLFQTSYLIGRLYHTDIREHGSGNAGTTNAMRTFGKKIGILTLFGDLLKCVAAVMLVRLIFGESRWEMLTLLAVYASAGCILGHNFPFYMGFRGGKGVAASLGFTLAIDWRVSVLVLLGFAAAVLLTGYVSLGSIVAYICGVTGFIVFGQMGSYGMEQKYLTEMYVVLACLLALTLFRHRENIARILNGTERKVSFARKK